MKNARSIDSYISDFPDDVQVILRKMRSTIRPLIPKVEEAVKYGIPTFMYNGKNLVHIGGFKDHVSLFPGSKGISVFKKELAKYKTSKGTIQFSLDQPIPYTLIKKVVRYCVKQFKK